MYKHRSTHVHCFHLTDADSNIQFIEHNLQQRHDQHLHVTSEVGGLVQVAHRVHVVFVVRVGVGIVSCKCNVMLVCMLATAGRACIGLVLPSTAPKVISTAAAPKSP